MHSPLGTVIPQILDGLRHAGVAEGNCLVVHSSLKSLGLADATPSDVIRTLSAAVGVVGTLVMPTFTYSYAGIFGVQPFHRDKTPGLLNGILTETLKPVRDRRNELLDQPGRLDAVIEKGRQDAAAAAKATMDAVHEALKF